MNPKETLAYWIKEREEVRKAKERGEFKPWSSDPIFQNTYFCNVRREDDRVTHWIRQNWTPSYLGWDDYEYTMVLARFINWPDTLDEIPLPLTPENVYSTLYDLKREGKKVWGDAYIVSTHGLPMGKAQYLCTRVLPAAYDYLGAGRWRGAYVGHTPKLAMRHADLMQLEGLASFMAAQVIADLKNTPGHPLYDCTDWSEWSAYGPGSLRGLGWFFDKKISPGMYETAIQNVKEYLALNHLEAFTLLVSPPGGFNMQDLQNCLCEYDKYMRIKNGTGRSKRSYPGA